MTNNNRKKLVLVGNGMAGIQTVEHILKLAPERYDITIFGSEPYPNYNRIMLSYVLEGSKNIDEIVLNDWSWYKENGITLYTDTTVARVDTQLKEVYTADGRKESYDKLILATGSKPFILPVPGADLEGVVGFRDIKDCEMMKEAAGQYGKAAVIGGGLLGLEAAKGLNNLGMDVTVVHLMNDLMERQLDPAASGMLKDELERQGLKFRMGAQTAGVRGENGRVKALQFADGTELETDFVVMAVGIKPNTEVAAASGIGINRGIVVDDYMLTSAPDVYAVGECCEHRGVCYGLVAPLFEQGQVLAKRLAQAETAPYEGSVTSTKLKISGVDVFSAGEFQDAPDLRVVSMRDDWKRVYKKLLLRNDKIVGGILFGDVTESSRLQKWVREEAELTADIHAALMGGGGCYGGGQPANLAAVMEDDEIVCGCNGVTKGAIVGCIKDQGMTSVDEIKAATGATRSCGGCKPLVEQILSHVLGDSFDSAAAKPAGICGCTTMGREEIVAAIRDKGLRHVREVMNVLGWSNPEGCSKCRPAVNYYLGMVYPAEYEEARDSRFVNERLHGNIQKDGTFSVVPRMYGGVTSPDELRRIADVADKYHVGMVKVTGGQRIDLLGIKKEDLPHIWEDLGMPSGYAYAKSIRTVKTCVGSRFCRFGTQDSIGVGIDMEKKFERLDMPAKFKMAVNGCPRNCAESGVKDLGIVGNDGGWEIYVGGNGGIKMREADLLCKVKTDEELMEISAAFIQYYRETANYAERTSDWVERVGLEAVSEAIVNNIENRKALVLRVEEALAMVADPWKVMRETGSLRKTFYENIELEVDGAELSAQAAGNVIVETRIGGADEFPSLVGKTVRAGTKEAAVFRLADGRLFAVDNTSPHQKGGPLTEGIVSGEYLYEPLHDWKIHLPTGEVQAPDRGQVRTYPVREDREGVHIGWSAAK
ncbi:nitrite reductase large subunit [Paenibacillus sambharensis]|uniref:Nitrite reductase large subunit n=1 Tax=Paenibacillus sambharensis TaxID=1803190 RepID=A0A2W1L8F5_9BACL|nr:nitrite reductase large subunit NirB [Paenibacillus sambharensis]PZD94420.1 nitrite reductase large subunit [Paenibacillus sambharensis]